VAVVTAADMLGVALLDTGHESKAIGANVVLDRLSGLAKQSLKSVEEGRRRLG
jgi:hypothetical protein